jgi:hypothetical protein
MTALLDNLARVEPPLDLPGCADLADEELVKEAATRIRLILGQTVQRGLEEVGQFLLDQFYDGSWEAYVSSSPSKHVSLRMLLNRCGTMELPVTKTWLARSIQMAVLVRRLPKHTRYLALPASHRMELLKVKSVEKVEQLAVRAYDSKLTIVKFREVVNKEVERSKSTKGRKPIPHVLKTLNTCMRALRDECTGKLTLHREDVNLLDPVQLEEAREGAEYLQKKAEELVKLLS